MPEAPEVLRWSVRWAARMRRREVHPVYFVLQPWFIPAFPYSG